MHLCYILPESEYEVWTQNWKNVAGSTGPLPYFLHEDKVQTGVKFHFNSLRYLFSTPSVITIKVRFGLREFPDGRTPQFHLILFGINSRGRVVTPYFTSDSFTHHHHYPKDVEDKGNLPQALMRLWKKSWHKKVASGVVSRQMFMLKWGDKENKDGGFLEGYNYSLRELMDAVGTFPGTSTLHIKFGLHKYFSVVPDMELSFVHTFGLIIYADARAKSERGIIGLAATTAFEPQAAKSTLDENSELDQSGYYDFSAPCPYTC